MTLQLMAFHPVKRLQIWNIANKKQIKTFYDNIISISSQQLAEAPIKVCKYI